MKKNLFVKYADIKNDISNLEYQLEELKPLIMMEIPEDGTAVELEDRGSFSIVKKKVWEYSEGVVKLKEKLKSEEALEQQVGRAKFTESPYLLFKPTK